MKSSKSKKTGVKQPVTKIGKLAALVLQRAGESRLEAQGQIAFHGSGLITG